MSSFSRRRAANLHFESPKLRICAKIRFYVIQTFYVNLFILFPVFFFIFRVKVAKSRLFVIIAMN